MAKTNLHKEEILARCEDYMLRGYQRPSELTQLLGVAYNTAKDYIEVVKKRWGLLGSIEERQQARSALVKRAEEVAKEAWLLKSDAKNVSEKVSALRTILMSIERLIKLQGLEDLPPAVSTEYLEEQRPRLLADEINKLPEEKRTKIVTLIDEIIKTNSQAARKELKKYFNEIDSLEQFGEASL